MPTTWDQEDFTTLITAILSRAPVDQVYGRGRRYMTAYQIAIEFARSNRSAALAVGQSTGGEGHGPFALTTYIARWLADRVSRGLAPGIEMQFLWSDRLSSAEFDNYGTAMITTVNQSGVDLIMFRLLDNSEALPEQTPPASEQR